MPSGRRRTLHRGERLVTSADLPRSPGRAVCDQLNRLLADDGSGRFAEGLCQAYYADEVGRPSLPRATHSRTLFIGEFEGIDSQRGIAWRSAGRFSLRSSLPLRPKRRPTVPASPRFATACRKWFTSGYSPASRAPPTTGIRRGARRSGRRRIAVVCVGRGARGCKRGGVNWRSGRSPACAKRVAVGERGWVAGRTRGRVI